MTLGERSPDMNKLDGELVVRTLEACRKLRTVDECCRVLEVSRVTFYNWLSGKTVPFRKERSAFIRLVTECKLGKLVNEWNGMK